MVVSIDLKPLTPEIIEQMGYDNHDLWLVRINTIVFGPFETESLKHYAHDNEHLFENAQASRADETDWKPFWVQTKFQRRKPQMISGEAHAGPFWLMENGLKTGPFTFEQIDKKIETHALGMTDHISVDNGESWPKIYEISGFDRRAHKPHELPTAPKEASFKRAKLEVIHKVEDHHARPDEAIAGLAWQGQKMAKVIEFRPEEMSYAPEQPAEVKRENKWATPATAAVIALILVGGYILKPSAKKEIVAENSEEPASQEKPFYQNVGQNNPPQGVVPSPSMRSPASVGYSHSAPATNYESRFPTHIETHDQFQEPENYSDPIENQPNDAEQEHSLVSTSPMMENPEDASLDGTMSGTPTEQPVIEEASDF